MLLAVSTPSERDPSSFMQDTRHYRGTVCTSRNRYPHGCSRGAIYIRVHVFFPRIKYARLKQDDGVDVQLCPYAVCKSARSVIRVSVIVSPLQGIRIRRYHRRGRRNRAETANIRERRDGVSFLPPRKVSKTVKQGMLRQQCSGSFVLVAFQRGLPCGWTLQSANNRSRERSSVTHRQRRCHRPFSLSCSTTTIVFRFPTGRSKLFSAAEPTELTPPVTTNWRGHGKSPTQCRTEPGTVSG